MNNGRWVTMNGRHVFIKDGQSPMDAFIRQSNKKMTEEEKTEEGRRIKNELQKFNSSKYEDGTYNVLTGEKVDFGDKGFNVSFEQSTDNYTDAQYYDKIEECRKLCDGNIYAGKFGGEPEISFYTKDKKTAVKIMKKYNQHSIWSNELGDVIENPDYNENKNPVNYKKGGK